MSKYYAKEKSRTGQLTGREANGFDSLEMLESFVAVARVKYGTYNNYTHGKIEAVHVPTYVHVECIDDYKKLLKEIDSTEGFGYKVKTVKGRGLTVSNTIPVNSFPTVFKLDYSVSHQAMLTDYTQTRVSPTYRKWRAVAISVKDYIAMCRGNF